MRHIYKKISLEPLKCRIPNTLVSFKDGKYIIPNYRTFYYDYPNGNYNTFCSDILFPTYFTGTSQDNYRIYCFSSVTEMTSVSINISSSVTTDIGYINDGIEYQKLSYSGSSISIGDNEYNRYFTYHKLHSWYRFFVQYFQLLHDTSCPTSKRVYKSAVDRYYAPREKDEWETLEFCQNMDDMFVARGGILGVDKDNPAHCDLYDWMCNYIFITYDMKQNADLIPYLNEWKNTVFNVVALMQWWAWFDKEYTLYSGMTDCISANTDDNNETDCCECNKYQRLGGNTMHDWLKECVGDYYSRAELIEPLCTLSAAINMPISFRSSDNVMGEQTPLIEEWEGGADFSGNKSIMGSATKATVIRYGGDGYLYDGNAPSGEDNNKVLTIQDTTFISDTEDYVKVENHAETAKGYYFNNYKEYSFLVSGNTIFKEYLPKYIEDNKEEFHLKDLEEISTKTYAFKDGKMVFSPTIDNMKISSNIILPLENCHLFYIDNEMFPSFTSNTLVDMDGYDVIDDVNPVLISYMGNMPYINYRGKEYFGVYSNGKYYFNIKYDLCTVKTKYTISETYREYITINDTYYQVSGNNVAIGDEIYQSVDGFVLINGETILLSGETYSQGLIKSGITCQYTLEALTDINKWKLVSAVTDTCGNLITDKWEEDNKEGKASIAYWIENNIFYYIKPYKIYDLSIVTATTRSRLDELKDYNTFSDKNCNLMDGLYCGTYFIPTDQDILDIYYHVGNASNLSYITTEEDTSEIVYKTDEKELKSTNVDYYWGNVLTHINFYFKDENDNIIKDTIVSASTYYTQQPSGKTKEQVYHNNLEDIEKCIKKYADYRFIHYKGEITSISGVSQGSIVINDDNNKIYKILSLDYNIDYQTGGVPTPLNYVQLQYIDEILENISDKLYCEITYNIGAIVKRPYNKEVTTSEVKYMYGLYGLTDKYHNGVEYKEEYLINLLTEKYYAEIEHYYDVKYYSLSATSLVEYYLDENITEDSEVFTANKAKISLERIYDVTMQSASTKFSKEINSSDADARQLNFYNGLMAAPAFMEEYNLGISSLRNINDNIYINRGMNYAYDKHLKLLEVKTLEALEQYNNGFYNIKDNNSED